MQALIQASTASAILKYQPPINMDLYRIYKERQLKIGSMGVEDRPKENKKATPILH